jgi:GT2 family glycosyltransferase
MLDKVSVIIPYVKDRGYLNEAIKSVECQNYKGEIELILSQSNKGVSYNLNRGINQATGTYIKYLCDDDKLTLNSISDSVRAMQGNDFIHGNAVNFWENGQRSIHVPNVTNPTLKQLLHRNHIHGGSLMYRRDVFERFGMFDESLTTGEEYDFNLMLLSNGAKLGYCKHFVYLYRRHLEQKSLGRCSNQHERALLIEEIKERYEDSSKFSNV